MKTYEDIMEKVRENEELREKFVKAFEEEKLLDFFSKEGVEATEEGVKDFLYMHSNYDADAAEMADEQLAQVSGGKIIEEPPFMPKEEEEPKKKCRVCKKVGPLKICITVC